MLSALELGHRAAADAAVSEDDKIVSSEKAAAIMRPHLCGLPHEEFWVLLLSQRNSVIKKICIGRGGLAATVVDVKMVLKAALENYTSALMVFHNHPSCNLRPSTADDQITRRIQEGCKAVDIRMLDHIIITDSGYYSYSDQGRLS